MPISTVSHPHHCLDYRYDEISLGPFSSVALNRWNPLYKRISIGGLRKANRSQRTSRINSVRGPKHALLLCNFPHLSFGGEILPFALPSFKLLTCLDLRGTLAGRVGPSLTLLGSCLAWLANVGSTFAAADMTLGFGGEAGSEAAPGPASALRFLESPVMGLMSFAETVSVVA